ncbi:hypothetical protein ACFFS2_03055 [Streptomyces aurantiacus]|uniref:Uncharacterized protein n=1 Tax=Streptomyces aurantiacus TaxID=47760 RepID=A0A7G1P6D7_9ACTN|nr:hypothetical protein [Streptomyces aurantiacus]BCL30928.1 hypothetical protein GCM10017557_57870 [Streptomyces aurantiacus]
MLNRIRRAAVLTKGRHASKGRHRRPLTPSRPSTAPTSVALTDEPTVISARASDSAGHRYVLTGEENALVRPYMLAWEKQTRQRPAVAVASYLPAEVPSALMEAI